MPIYPFSTCWLFSSDFPIVTLLKKKLTMPDDVKQKEHVMFQIVGKECLNLSTYRLKMKQMPPLNFMQYTIFLRA